MIVALLAVIAGCLLMDLGMAVSPAPAEVGAGSAGPVFAVAGQVTPETYGLYLVDTQNGTICVYQYFANIKQLRLIAARTFTYDCQLDQYNTEPPPREIKDLVQKQRRLRTVTTQPDEGGS